MWLGDFEGLLSKTLPEPRYPKAYTPYPKSQTPPPKTRLWLVRGTLRAVQQLHTLLRLGASSAPDELLRI